MADNVRDHLQRVVGVANQTAKSTRHHVRYELQPQEMIVNRVVPLLYPDFRPLSQLADTAPLVEALRR